jgi:hypothetical protein
MADITDTSFIIGNDQADVIIAGFGIGMIGILAIPILAVAKMPDIGDNVILTGGGIGKMDGQGTGNLFPVEPGLARKSLATKEKDRRNEEYKSFHIEGFVR